MIGFFSFTEVTDPAAHRAYNEWHLLDHMPEQFSIDGIRFGQRWVCTPECREARLAASPLLERCHYMTLYLMRDADVIPDFFALAKELRDADRFFAERHSHLSGPFEIVDRWAAPRVKVSAAAIPFRPSAGIYVVVGPPVDGAALVALDGVAGAWQFAESTPANSTATPTTTTRHITLAFIDADLAPTAATITATITPALTHDLKPPQTPDYAGPLQRIDPDISNWFDRLTP